MDTIVAVATPPGRSAIGIVRLSGPESLPIVRSLVSDEGYNPQPAKVVLKSIQTPANGLTIDQALISYFETPNSYTGEDVIEISCHGSPVILRQLVDATLSLGARLASPGEFTLRALSNGKINLSQAEAIRDLIEAQTDAAAQQAIRQLSGELSNRLQPIKDELLNLIVQLESAVEFVEDDLPALQRQSISSRLGDIVSQVQKLADTFRTGHLLRDGLSVAIVGRPNVGKSTVFNSLLRFERAIVTSLAGTTRDTLSEKLSISGIPVVLTDTAGLRADTDDVVESLGLERTRQAMADADLLLVVMDGSTEITNEDREILESDRGIPKVITFNKSDLDSFNVDRLGPENGGTRVISVSAKTGSGIEDLRSAIVAPFQGRQTNTDGLLITDARHFDLLCRAGNEMASSADLLETGATEELVLAGLHNALRFLGSITGETTAEDVLSQIFATFCIGK
jgi:tRNA modification GTPase